MNTRQNRLLQSFRRARQFVDTLPQPTVATTMAEPLAMLDAAIAALTGHAVTQSLAPNTAHADSIEMREMARALRDAHLRPIAQIARALAPEHAALHALRLPGTHVGVEQLLYSADAMATAAEPHAALFTRQGLPSTFVADLRAAVTTLRSALDANAATRRQRVTATAGARAEVDRGRRAVRLVDGVLARLLAADPARFAEWRRASHVGHTSRATVAEPPVARQPADAAPATTLETAPEASPEAAPETRPVIVALDAAA
jgi:hypothetical protein